MSAASLGGLKKAANASVAVALVFVALFAIQMGLVFVHDRWAMGPGVPVVVVRATFYLAMACAAVTVGLFLAIEVKETRARRPFREGVKATAEQVAKLACPKPDPDGKPCDACQEQAKDFMAEVFEGHPVEDWAARGTGEPHERTATT